jgi:hypothetical protein
MLGWAAVVTVPAEVAVVAFPDRLPANVVVVNVFVFGLYDNPVSVLASSLPVAASTNTGKYVAETGLLVATSVTVVAAVAVVAVVALPLNAPLNVPAVQVLVDGL